MVSSLLQMVTETLRKPVQYTWKMNYFILFGLKLPQIFTFDDVGLGIAGEQIFWDQFEK